MRRRSNKEVVKILDVRTVCNRRLRDLQRDGGRFYGRRSAIMGERPKKEEEK